MESGDALLVIAGLRAESDLELDDRVERQPIDGPFLAELILRNHHNSSEETVRLLQALLHKHRHIWQAPPGLILLRRD